MPKLKKPQKEKDLEVLPTVEFPVYGDVNVAQHSSYCIFCKHPAIDEIEHRWLSGTSTHILYDEFKAKEGDGVNWTVSKWTERLKHHLRVVELFDQQDIHTRKVCLEIIDAAKIGQKKPSDSVLNTALQMLGRIDGTDVVRTEHTNKVEMTIITNQGMNDRMANLAKVIKMDIDPVELIEEAIETEGGNGNGGVQ